MNKFIIAGLGLVVVVNAYASYGQKTPDATENDITTSRAYVDTALANTQDTIPVKSGDKVVTYTGTKGTIGERDIVTTIGDGNGLTTVGTVKTELANKQAKIRALPATNVITYTGTNEPSPSYSPGRGNMTVTPIYDDTVNTFQNGLVRAETLNEAVAAGVRKSLIGVGADGVTPSDTPMFWRVNSNFTDVLPTTANLRANADGLSGCFRRVQVGEGPYSYEVGDNHCSELTLNSLSRGDWGALFPYRTGITYGNDTCTGSYCGEEVRGISACIDKRQNFVYPNQTELVAKLNQAYESGKTGATQTGNVCYCKLSAPTVPGAPWVLYSPLIPCEVHCASSCYSQLIRSSEFRSKLFSAAPTE